MSDSSSQLQISRKIIHLDMDAFFAAVEQRDEPKYRGKPVIVGGKPSGRGVVATASYEARKFGIRSAMSSAKAYRLCPNAIFLPPRFERYREVSGQIRDIFHQVTDLVEPCSLDEAYLDVTENKLGEDSATRVAKWIKDQILKKTGLTASAGVSPIKFVSKVASDFKKPNGLFVVRPEELQSFIDQLPVEKIWSVGPVTAQKLKESGVHYAKDLKEMGSQWLKKRFGKHGVFLFSLATGQDQRKVHPHWERKSYGREQTFHKDILDRQELIQVLFRQSDQICKYLKKSENQIRTLTLKLRYSDFKTVTRSSSFKQPTDQFNTIFNQARELLLEQTEAGKKFVRLMGLSVSGFAQEVSWEQLSFDLPLDPLARNRYLA